MDVRLDGAASVLRDVRLGRRFVTCVYSGCLVRIPLASSTGQAVAVEVERLRTIERARRAHI